MPEQSNEVKESDQLPQRISRRGAVKIGVALTAAKILGTAEVKQAYADAPTATPSRTPSATPTTRVDAINTQIAKRDSTKAALAAEIEAKKRLQEINNDIATQQAQLKDIEIPPTSTPSATQTTTPIPSPSPLPTVDSRQATATADAIRQRAIGEEMGKGKMTATAEAERTVVASESPEERRSVTPPQRPENGGQGVSWGIVAAGGAVAGAALTRLFASEKVRNIAVAPIKYVRRFIQGFRGAGNP